MKKFSNKFDNKFEKILIIPVGRAATGRLAKSLHDLVINNNRIIIPTSITRETTEENLYEKYLELKNSIKLTSSENITSKQLFTVIFDISKNPSNTKKKSDGTDIATLFSQKYKIPFITARTDLNETQIKNLELLSQKVPVYADAILDVGIFQILYNTFKLFEENMDLIKNMDKPVTLEIFDYQTNKNKGDHITLTSNKMRETLREFFDEMDISDKVNINCVYGREHIDSKDFRVGMENNSCITDEKESDKLKKTFYSFDQNSIGGFIIKFTDDLNLPNLNAANLINNIYNVSRFTKTAIGIAAMIANSSKFFSKGMISCKTFVEYYPYVRYYYNELTR